jgi:hypothetical protein
MSEHNNEEGGYLRLAIVSREHPTDSLKGTVVVLEGPVAPTTDDSYFREATERTKEMFDISSYAHGLRFGTVYFDESSHEFIGVSWESSPVPYGHGEFSEPIYELPENLTMAGDLID